MPTAYEKTTALVQCWLLSIAVQARLKDGTIPRNFSDRKVQLVSNGQDIAEVSFDSFSDVAGIAKNLSNVTKGSCFIQFEKALDETLGDRPKGFPKGYQDMTEGVLRVIIHMMRSALSHNPAHPTWRIGREYKDIEVLELPSTSFRIDLRKIHQQPLDESQHGGSKSLYELMLYCLKVIKEHEVESGE